MSFVLPMEFKEHRLGELRFKMNRKIDLGNYENQLE
jgi:hypothetical protein